MLFPTLSLLNVANYTNATEDEFTLTTPTPNFNISEQYNLTENAFARMPQEIKITSAVGVTLLSFLAFIGNTMTIVAHITDEKLHTVYDFYIFNLAIADLFIACFSIPLYVVYTLNGYWPFGVAVCKMWLLMDYSVCTEAIFLMLILSIDRLLLVTLELQYAVKVTMTKAKIQIVISWIFAFLIYGPAVVWWDSWVGYSVVPTGECYVEFAYDKVFTLVYVSLYFIIPTAILIILNIVIFWKVLRRINGSYLKTVYHNQQFKSSEDVEKGDKTKMQLYTVPPITATKISDFKPEVAKGASTSNEQKDTVCEQFQNTSINHNRRANRIRTHRQLKAARVLLILVSVFLLCWAPASVLNLLVSLCTTCVDKIVFEFFYWWVWLKSAVNPLLYAFSNKQYRWNFRKYLFFCHNCWHKRNHT